MGVTLRAKPCFFSALGFTAVVRPQGCQKRNTMHLICKSKGKENANNFVFSLMTIKLAVLSDILIPPDTA